MSRLGIDPDQVKGIDPVFLSALYYDVIEVRDKKNPTDVNKGKFSGDEFYSFYYEVTWIFSVSDHVYVHSTRFDTTSDSHVTLSEDYFYKDIISFSFLNTSIQKSVLQESEEAGCGKKEVKREYVNKTTRAGKFKTGLPETSFECSYDEGDSSIATKVNAMKQRLRDKKQG